MGRAHFSENLLCAWRGASTFCALIISRAPSPAGRWGHQLQSLDEKTERERVSYFSKVTQQLRALGLKPGGLTSEIVLLITMWPPLMVLWNTNLPNSRPPGQVHTVSQWMRNCAFKGKLPLIWDHALSQFQDKKTICSVSGKCTGKTTKHMFNFR